MRCYGLFIYTKTFEDEGIIISHFNLKTSPFLTSGLRIGTPAITTRGLKEDMMEPIVDMIDDVISAIDPVAKTAPDAKINAVREKVNMMMAEYPLFAW